MLASSGPRSTWGRLGEPQRSDSSSTSPVTGPAGWSVATGSDFDTTSWPCTGRGRFGRGTRRSRRKRDSPKSSATPATPSGAIDPEVAGASPGVAGLGLSRLTVCLHRRSARDLIDVICHLFPEREGNLKYLRPECLHPLGKRVTGALRRSGRRSVASCLGTTWLLRSVQGGRLVGTRTQETWGHLHLCREGS